GRRCGHFVRGPTGGRNLRPGVHLAATLHPSGAIPHDSTLTSRGFFLCSGASTEAHKRSALLPSTIRPPSIREGLASPGPKIERDDRAGHGTLCHLTNLD